MGSHLWILPSCVCGFAYSVCGVHLLSISRDLALTDAICHAKMEPCLRFGSTSIPGGHCAARTSPTAGVQRG
ncbi:hypothetical protein PF005_g21003 [Phytophthora fragariae]|uniref:Uncharacterized protein n=1 Tax=Phytophthora fragariae TaxID=53985 RepID=A0A6A3WJ66_9STRA|nr:hypothetical protein PF003_g21278 [Phytophthora fragariae]KAE8925975.1 hypothetical protein PF009_g23828 [Phytophthora fragariae]KAE8978304.1 hypothetical protein PF011_g23301 [Phytophthora fragariae]KAE9072029.1 hypothetical protein PF007_g26327 [Phytophthora fragariae]KAE9083574.1 hypothetical protein PF010_g21165 [Phytophthora fragariae]